MRLKLALDRWLLDHDRPLRVDMALRCGVSRREDCGEEEDSRRQLEKVRVKFVRLWIIVRGFVSYCGRPDRR